MKQKPKEKGETKKQLKAEPQPGQLKERLDGLQREKDELFAKLQRVSADYANFQKRAPRQIAEAITYEKEKIIKTLLPALDNFEHTLDKAHSAESVETIVKGIQIIYDQMLDILKSHGIEQIKALGENFDPALHEAMMQRHDGDKEPNTVLEEYQKGFKLNGRVIRPSKVIVNKGPAAEATEQSQTTEQTEQQKEANQAESKDVE